MKDYQSVKYGLINCSRFLLPSLHIKMVLQMPTIAERREALEILPTDLYNSFRGIMTRIRGRPTELGMRVLMWLHFAYRPLRLIELQHALAVKEGQKEFNADYIPSQKVLLDCCLGLVLVDEKTQTVRFTHFTIEEYFRKNGGPEFPDGCSYIAKSCLTYLNFSGLRQHCTNHDSLKEKITEYAFLDYAALYWGTYYVKDQCGVSLTKLARTILEHETERPLCAIQALYYSKLNEWERREYTAVKKFSGVHVIAYFGLNDFVAGFRKVELEDELGRTPLSWAAERGHETVVRLLVERDDVDINAKDADGRTPLIWSAERGHEAVVWLLVERDGVNINAEDYEGKTPLMWAAEEGHEAVVRLLIERDGIDIDAKDCAGGTPLMWAALYGYEAIVRVLVERDDVDLNPKDNQGKTPLMWAAEFGHETVVRLLIERDGVDINATDKYGNTALSLAVAGVEAPWIWKDMEGLEAVVQLLNHRCDVQPRAPDSSLTENVPSHS